MSTIFPLSASVGQVFNGYTFDGTSWNINGIDLNTNYLEESSASVTYALKDSPTFTGSINLGNNSSIGPNNGGLYLTSAGQINLTYAPTVNLPSDTNIGTVSATEIGYLDGVTSGIQSQID